MTIGSSIRSSLAAAGTVVGLAATPAAALDLDFDFKINQGPTGVTFATLSLNELVPGTTTFSLTTLLSGGQGNPDIVELQFGCNGCGTPTFVSGPGVTVGPGGTQAGYNFDFRATFNPDVNSTNDPVVWAANGSLASFLDRPRVPDRLVRAVPAYRRHGADRRAEHRIGLLCCPGPRALDLRDASRGSRSPWVHGSLP